MWVREKIERKRLISKEMKKLFTSALHIHILIATLFITVCRQMESGVQAVFGPSDPVLGAHIQSICEALDIPHIESRIDLEPLSKELSINLHPSQENMNRAYKDLMTFLNWTKVAIIYEEDYGKWTQQSEYFCFFIWYFNWQWKYKLNLYWKLQFVDICKV